MSEIQAPQIVTLKNLQKFKDGVLTSTKLTPESNTIINSIVQLNANIDTNTKTQHELSVQDSAIFGTDHTASNLINIFVAGRGHIAAANDQTILGTFNEPDSNALIIFGNGTNNVNRSNIITVYKDIVNLNGFKVNQSTTDVVLGTTEEAKQLKLAKKLYYADNINENLTQGSINTFIQNINALDDNELVSAYAVKQIAKCLDKFIYSDTQTISDAIKDLEDKVAALVVDNDGNTVNDKAYSATAGQELYALIESITSLTKDEIEGATDIIKQISTLKEQVSYLISCLTVDKVSNADYKKENEDLIEFYTVGIADFALDADTEFKLTELN